MQLEDEDRKDSRSPMLESPKVHRRDVGHKSGVIERREKPGV